MTESNNSFAQGEVEITEGKQAILGVLDNLEAADLRARLDMKLGEAQAVDPKAGIVILPLEEIPPVDHEGQSYNFYGARVMPASPDNPNYVNPHVHQEGLEPYRFVAGSGGEMNKGRIEDGSVVWDEPKTVAPGETEIINPGEVHSFRNTAETPFDFAFACPDSHLVDHTQQQPEGDRQFTANLGLENALPPQYPA